MVEINNTLFMQIGNFLILILLMNLLLYRPILSILNKRQEQIASAENEVKDLNLSIQNKMTEYERQIQQAKLDAMAERNMIIQQGVDAGKEIIDVAKQDVSALLDEFQRNLDAEVNAAKDVLRNQSGKISTEIAEKILGRSI